MISHHNQVIKLYRKAFLSLPVIVVAVLVLLTTYSLVAGQSPEPSPTATTSPALSPLPSPNTSQSPTPSLPPPTSSTSSEPVLVVCPAVSAPECEANWKSPACQETIKNLEKQYPGCFTDWIVACPEMTAPECEADLKSLACQEIARKLEKQYPACFTDWILPGPSRDLQLRGKVVDAGSGANLQGIKVQGWSLEVENVSDETVTQKDGSFVFPVFKGRWQVAASSEDGKYVYLGSDIFVNAPQKASDGELVIKVHVSFAVAGKIVHGPDISPKTNYWIGFTPAGGETLWFELTNQGGPFKVEGLTEGKYTVELWQEDTALILSDPFEIEISSKNTSQNVFALKSFEVKQANDKIRGRVFNVHDKKGVANVPVFAQTQVGRQVKVETKTDQSGAYELTVFPGSWIVWPDFSERKDLVQGGDALYVTVQAGVPSAADFPVLAADATVKGVVSLDGVKSIAKLSAYVEFYPPDGSNLPILGAEVEDGQFSLQLPAATYGVWLYLPSGSDYALTTIQSLQEVILKSGENPAVVLTVKERDAVIEGALKDPKGNIIKGVPVTVYAETAGITEETKIDPKTGRYQMRVYSGVYRTWTISYAIGETTRKFLSDQYASYALPIAANARVTQDIVIHEADASLSGKVYDAKGKPLADVAIQYSNWDSEGNLLDPNAPWFNGWTSTAQNGSYELFLPAGTYRISVHLEGHISPAEQTVKISRDAPIKADFRFLPIDATISGLVRLNGKGIGGWVSGWSEGGASVQANTDADGHFVFRLSHDVWHFGATATVGNKYYVSDEVVIDTTKETSTTITLDLRLEQEYVLPPSTTRTFDASALAVLTMDDRTKITIPAGAIRKSGTLTIVASPNVFLPVEEDARPLGLGYDLQARDANGKNITKFLSDVFVSIPYTDAQLQLYGLTEKDLLPVYWDEKAGTWLPVKNVSIDREHKYIVVATDHFTLFAIVVAKPIKSVSSIPPIAVKQVPEEKLERAVAQVTLKPTGIAKTSASVFSTLIVLIILVIIIFAIKFIRKKTLGG